MNKTALPRELNGVHLHFVGIKGTGMAALVEILYSRGACITGSDVSERFYTDEILDKLHLKAVPFSADNITSDVKWVIYSSAYDPDKNPDLIEAGKKNIPCLLYTEALGQVSSLAYSCGICGVHGKTTTTGLTGTILESLNLPVQVLAGSIITSFGETCTMTAPACSKSGPKYFVAETCEYKRHFMSFCPRKIILTSVESDHQDFYPTYQDIQAAFVDYVCRLPKGGQLIYCADDQGAVKVSEIVKQQRSDITLVPYGEKASGPYRLVFGKIDDGKQYFTIEELGECAIRVPGRHMVRNAVAACALSCELLKNEGSVPTDYKNQIQQGLLAFTGGKRRSEIVGKTVNKYGDSVIVIDDYGHHPTAIKTTLSGYREFYPQRKIIIDFMSHTYTRTAALLNDFAQSFNNADQVILHKIYASAREDPSSAPVTGETLFKCTQKYHKYVSYFQEVLDAKDFVLLELNKKADKNYPDGYLFVTMGAGDNWKLGKEVYQNLISKPEEQK